MRIRRICAAQPADPASYGEKAAPQAQVRRSALETVKVVLKTPRCNRSHAVGRMLPRITGVPDSVRAMTQPLGSTPGVVHKKGLFATSFCCRFERTAYRP